MSSALDAVVVVPRRRREDGRGWLHVALDASDVGDDRFGELYLVQSARRGDRRGDHYHREATEWFSVAEGAARLELMDPATGERRAVQLRADEPSAVRVPAGVAHCFVNATDAPLLVVAWSTEEHDPADVVACSTAGP